MKLRQITIWFSVSLALSSCSGKWGGWTSGKITSTSLTCSHLTFPAQNFYRDLEVHLQSDGEQVHIFLNVHSIPFESDSQGLVLVTLETDEYTSSFLAPALAGKQRLLLPPEAKEMLLNALFEQHNVMIRAGRYSTELTPEFFLEKFQQF